jgi:hypothetical protein
MLVSSTTIVLIAIATIVSGQQLAVIENDKICTQWQYITGSDITVNIDPSPCSGGIAYELSQANNLFVVRFCCPYRSTPATPAPEVGPAPTQCGKQAVTPIRTRIVGGQDAVAHSWPWLVSLQYNGGHFCGGTLIDEYHVVTAAHCLQETSMFNSGLTIVAGLHTKSQPHPQRSQRRQVARIMTHENYNDVTSENDVAVIRLATPVQLNSYVNVICLPQRDPAVNENVMIAGWGTTSFGGSTPDTLRQANIMIMDYCQYVYRFDTSKQVCAGNPQYSKDSCQGDSGGPLMHEADGQWVLSGIVSYGDECAKKDRPGVYARVSHYLPWIRSKVATA